jgi:hypothetical protein
MKVTIVADIFTFKPRDFFAQRTPSDPEGVYTVRVPSADLRPSERYRDLCGSFANALAVTCDSLSDLGEEKESLAFKSFFCARVGIAALAVGTAPPSFAGCLTLLTAFELYCKTLGDGIPGGPSLAERLLELPAVEQILSPLNILPLTIPVATTFSVNGKLQPQATRPFIPSEVAINLSDCEPVNLRVEVVGTGNGTVVSEPGGIACDKPGCSALFQPPRFDAGSIGSFSVSSPTGCNWSASSDSLWLTFFGDNRGSGSGSVAYSASENNVSSTRRGAITVSSDQNSHARAVFSVTQDGCSASFRNSGREVDSGSGGGSASVSPTTSRCPWNASENSDWLSLMTSSGTGNGSVTFSFSANSSSFSRGAIISIGNSTFVLTQRGKPLSVKQSPTTPMPTPKPE